MVVAIRREYVRGTEQWELIRRIGYRDRHYAEPFVVPVDKDTFRTDLTSVPAVFAWLVPTTGAHLPAALLHDGLVVQPGEEPTHIGPRVTRIQADRVFRDAMADLRTPLIRRWLVWTAVTLVSVRTVRPRFLRALMYAVLGLVPVLGVMATLDLFDVLDWLPWMGSRPLGAELLFGAAGAVAIPFLLMVPWAFARLYSAGVIAGVAIATLLHVTIAVGLVLLVYLAAEKLVDRTA